jgi:hypothetical protein
MRRVWLAVLLVLTLALVSGGPALAQEEALPLGSPDLEEERESRELVPGVTYTQILRGEESAEDFYSVEIDLYATEREAQEVADVLSGDYEPRVEEVASGDGPLGYRVRVGEFESEAAASGLQEELAGEYEEASVVYTGNDGEETTGPWVLNVLEVDPDAFEGSLLPELGNAGVAGREPLTGIAERTGALAAVNAGYFVVTPEDGTEGDLAGISVLGGELVSEAVDGRTGLIFSPDGEARIAPVVTRLTAGASGAEREVDGLNRAPGLIRSCGGVGGDEPTEEPKHDFTCTDDSELIHFTPAFGAATEPGEGVEAILDGSGTVTGLRQERGGPIPAGGSVLAGTGGAAGWLRENARPGERVEVSYEVRADGEPLELDESVGIVNGGPRLLSGGEPEIPAAEEGFVWNEDPGFYYAFGHQRNPRTLVGVRADGTLLLVAVDGRQPGYSVGASFEESAGIMHALGAEDAVNLDGGGSTSITVGGELVNSPSDETGERPIGDAVLVLPGTVPDTGGPPLPASVSHRAL